MPRHSSAKSDRNVPGRKGVRKPRIAANGHRLPDPIPRGEVLTDVLKRKWKLGKSIGLGGFGEIYLASDDVRRQPGPNAKYVIKVEPHSNGPLFAEMHFYHRVGKADQIKAWMKMKKLKFLGMPKFIGSGSHEFRGTKYRFMIMERFGEDLQKYLERNNRVFPVKTVYTLGIKILHILEYIHSHGYIHADVKASNLTSGFGKGKENDVHLIDYGLACRYISQGVHKEYKEDLRKAHDGTIEYTSRDAHIGAHSRRGDLEVLGYNMLQWLSGHLPWEDNLKDPEYVSQQKNLYMNNIPLLLKSCFPSDLPPQGIEEYLNYVAGLRFEEEPDYKHCYNMLKSAIKACGYRDDGKLVYISERCSYPGASRKRQLPRGSLSPPRKHKKTELLMNKMPSESSGMPAVPGKSIRRAASATTPVRSSKDKKKSDGDYISTIDNPTPAMLLVMQRKMEQQQQQAELRRMKSAGGGGAHTATSAKNENNLLKDLRASLKAKLSGINSDESISPTTLNGTHKKIQQKAPTLKTKKTSVSYGIRLRSQRRKSSTQRL